ncbi:carbohydrate esterase family 3 protein [Hyaloscypha hepaticicola]|uniref:Carbohydrate esterase family 3 protein n=1 Tax=Hyaloscypha hepaticicola TaxID=2082293 RepID=A0A2J6PSR2_9HELO|nr:carbohydrate esterase family 3 protein [Hyaloscypha hepaticicola]
MAVFSSLLTVLAWSAPFHGKVIAEGVNATSVPFRIMSLGASVTFGVGSTPGESYRKDLEDLLVTNGNTVSYVGTKKNANFTDNDVQATPGFVISQIAEPANTALNMLKSNLVLLEAGTNNCNKVGTVPDAGTNVTNLINRFFKQTPVQQ